MNVSHYSLLFCHYFKLWFTVHLPPRPRTLHHSHLPTILRLLLAGGISRGSIEINSGAIGFFLVTPRDACLEIFALHELDAGDTVAERGLL